jgi:hypothetical protein
VQRSDALQVLGRDARDDARVRLCDLGEPPHLAGTVHAELDDGDALRFLEPEQGERQADEIVLRAARVQHGVRPERLAENRRRHLLGGRLAVASRDGEHARAPAAAMKAARSPS